jgi:hypothetical protein
MNRVSAHDDASSGSGLHTIAGEVELGGVGGFFICKKDSEAS